MKALIKINGVEVEISPVSSSDRELQSVVNYMGIAFASYARYLKLTESQILADQALEDFERCYTWCRESGFYERI